MNEKRRIFLFNNINIIIFIYHNKSKNNQSIKKNFNNNNNREICSFYKVVNKKFKHSLIKY